LRSEGKANPSSKSSSIVLEAGGVCDVTLGVSLPKALMVDTPSSSPSSAGEVEGGRIVNTEDVNEEAKADRVGILAMTVWALGLVVGQRSISMSRSSSLSDGVVMGAPSGRSKSASGHSSCERTRLGAGMVGMSWEVQYRACGRTEKVAN